MAAFSVVSAAPDVVDCMLVLRLPRSLSLSLGRILSRSSSGRCGRDTGVAMRSLLSDGLLLLLLLGDLLLRLLGLRNKGMIPGSGMEEAQRSRAVDGLRARWDLFRHSLR